VPDYDLEPCKACGSVVVHKAINTERKGLCQRCWDDPLKRAAALFGEDPEADPPGLPPTDREREGTRPGITAGPGVTGMYAMAVILAPGWLMQRTARKLLGWPPAS
jgi:hypothetical protein